MSVTQARTLRRRASPTEIRLWRALRLRPEGFKFRRQHPFGPFVFDFFCSSAGLAIEVDGLAHGFQQRAQRDDQRDHWAGTQGIETLRILAEDVRVNLEAVVVQIVDRCAARTPPPHFVRSPSPAKAGEDVRR
ncbi:MAG: endonuclease domain-containing protein [Sphingomicrobium sp.]